MRRSLVVGLVFVISCLNAVASTSYLLGEIKIVSAAGKDHGKSLSLSKRTMDPKAQAIIEEVVHVTSQGEVKEYLTVMKVNGSRFTMKDGEDTYRGEGELTGKPWQWTKWKAKATFIDGTGGFRTQHHLVPGGILVKKEFFDPHGKLRLKFTEDFKFISQEAYDIIHGKLTKTLAKAPVG